MPPSSHEDEPGAVEVQHSFTTHHTISMVEERKYHRVPALLGAALSSAAVLLAVFAGTSCEFLTVSTTTNEEPFLIAPDGAEGFEQTQLRQTSIGVMCSSSDSTEQSSFYDRDGDDMWQLSRVFWILGLSLGSMTAALAWACIVLKPSLKVWKSISIFAALAAVLQVPVFILFESEPCSAFSETQECSMGQGAFLLIASDILYIAVCLCTQCLDPPDEKLALCEDAHDVWKNHRNNKSSKESDNPDYYYNTGYRNHHSKKSEYYDYDDEADNDRINLWVQQHGAADDDDDEHGNDNVYITRILPASKTHDDNEKQQLKQKPEKSKKGGSGLFASLFSSKKQKDTTKKTADKDIDLEVPQVETESTKEQEDSEEDDDYADFEGLHHQLDDSQVILQILPDKSAPPPPTTSRNANLLDDEGTAEHDFELGKKVELDNESDVALADEAETQEWASQAQWPTRDDSNKDDENANEKPPSPEPTIEKDLPNNNDAPLTSNAILKDLKVVEAVTSTNTDPDPVFSSAVSNDEQDGVNNKPPCTSSDMLLLGVRSLTQRLKRDSKSKKKQQRKKSRQTVMGSGRKGGYATLEDDEYDAEYDSDEGAATLDSPPLELKLPVKERDSAKATNPDDTPNTSADSNGVFADSGIQFQMPDFSDDDEEDIFMENNSWNDMAAATSAGIRQAVEDFDRAVNPFFADTSVGSWHSDPEPVLRESENEDAGAALNESFGDNSILADDEHHSDPGQDSRGRSTSRRDGRRRRAASPVESIKSHCSLLHTTIHEETEEDLKQELDTAYSLTRTVSAPEPRAQSRTVTQMRPVDLLKTLGSDTASFDDRKISALEKKLESDADVDEGDIPMLSKRKTESVSATSTNDTSKAMMDAIPRPMDEDDEESELDIKPVVSQNATQPEEAVNLSLSMESSSRANHTWKEPELPTKKVWKEGSGDSKADTTTDPKPSKTWKEPTLLSDRKWRDVLESRATNISDATSDTDVSRTTDSFSDDSGSENGDRRRRAILRSRSFGGSAIKSKKSSHATASRSLSPSRARSIRKLMSMPDGSATARRARDIRIRRLQKLKGYSPLDDEPGTPTRGTKTPSEELTPKRKTLSDSFDEKKEDEAIYGGDPLTTGTKGAFPEDLMQPSLGAFPTTAATTAIPQDDDSEYVEESEVESPEFDSMLSELDLQLIDLRRPVGAEYGDDEGSL